MHTVLEKTTANNAMFQVDCLVIFAGNFTGSITNIKLSALKENKAQPAMKCIGFLTVRLTQLN